MIHRSSDRVLVLNGPLSLRILTRHFVLNFSKTQVFSKKYSCLLCHRECFLEDACVNYRASFRGSGLQGSTFRASLPQKFAECSFKNAQVPHQVMIYLYKPSGGHPLKGYCLYIIPVFLCLSAILCDQMHRRYL